jgi:hypothetical protein
VLGSVKEVCIAQSYALGNYIERNNRAVWIREFGASGLDFAGNWTDCTREAFLFEGAGRSRASSRRHRDSKRRT